MCNDIVKDHFGLTIALTKRFFPFLFRENRDEVISFATTIKYEYPGRSVRDTSNFIQRNLYRLATQSGWRKNRQNNWRWEKKEVKNDSRIT